MLLHTGKTPMISDYCNLVVWRKAVDLAKAIHKLTNELPRTEQFGLAAQLRRAAVSVPSNIAEGNARQSRRDYIHFLTVARGSLAEVDTQLTIAEELALISGTEALRTQLAEVARLLQALINSLRRLDT
ncbi:MAG: four helix bundle protein [Planctomycetota bacterium]